jgi:hypothetical protein
VSTAMCRRDSNLDICFSGNSQFPTVDAHHRRWQAFIKVTYSSVMNLRIHVLEMHIRPNPVVVF